MSRLPPLVVCVALGCSGGSDAPPDAEDIHASARFSADDAGKAGQWLLEQTGPVRNPTGNDLADKRAGEKMQKRFDALTDRKVRWVFLFKKAREVEYSKGAVLVC